MGRLIKRAANLDEVKKILDRVSAASVDLKDTYYVLFDNLNALYEAYPDLYKQIEMVVKLPTNDDAKGVIQFDSDLRDILEHFKDEDYLRSYISLEDFE